MGINIATVLNAVTESGIDQFDAKLSHQQHHVVIYRRNTGGDGDVEGDRAAIILRHIGRNRISADLIVGLEQPEIKSVRVMMQRPGGPQP